MKFKLVKSFIKNNLKFYLSLIFCTAICFSAYVTFYHVNISIEEGLNDYLQDYNYYDGLVQPYFGSFTQDEIDSIKSLDEISHTKDAYIIDSIISNDDKYRYLRLIGIDINKDDFYVIDECDDGDIYLSALFANVNNYKIGDTITININDNDVSLKIKGIVNTPEIMGAIRTITYSLEQTSLGYAYIDIDKLKEYTYVDNYNTITYYLKNSNDSKEIVNKIKNIFLDKQIYYEENDGLLAKNNVKNDLAVLNPIASILPLFVYAMGMIIAILFIRQFMDTKMKEIGILKSNGISNLYIISIFIYYSLSISLIGSILGIILSIIQSRIYTNFYTVYNYLPVFDIKTNYKIVLIAILISTVINIISVILNVKKIIKIDILNIINGTTITKYKNIKLLRNKLITVKSFISSIFNKPFRFIFLIVNMVFVVILVTASIGVKESKDASINYIYNDQINYDYVIHYHSYTPFENNNDNSFKETMVKINDEYEKLYIINNTNYLNIYDIKNNKISLDDGIIISNKLADKLYIYIGDYVHIDDKIVKVSNISKEVTDYKSYMPYKVYNELFNDNSSNAYFVNDNIDDYNLKNPSIYYISNTKTLKDDIVDKFSYISDYILIIIAISCLISIIVIFNMSIIYYKERYREHKVLRTIGYSYKKIISLSLIEIIIESIISLVIGIPIGYYCSAFVISKINNNTITMYSSFKDIPILFITLFIILIAIIGRIIASHNQIKLVDDNE